MKRKSFENAIAMVELGQSERANPNRDIYSCFQIMGISIVFIMLGTMESYSMIGVTLGLIGSGALVGCLFVLDDTIIHAELRWVNVSIILIMIVQYGLLFEYLLDSPAAEYLLILLRTIFFAIFFGSLVSCFARTEFLFPSIAARLCAQTPAFLACYACIIQSVSIMMHYAMLDPYFASEVIISLSGIVGSITGVFIAMVFFRVPLRTEKMFHAISDSFHGFIRKISNRRNRNG